MTATEVLNGRRRIPAVVRLDAPYRSTPEAVGQTLVRTPAGGTVALSQFARVSVVDGSEVINHEGGQRYVVVQSNVRRRDFGGFVTDVKRAVAAQVSLPSRDGGTCVGFKLDTLESGSGRRLHIVGYTDQAPREDKILIERTP
ncbi:MAG: efflux RND transporter permease subunit [Gemmatimonadota bacterium]|nr:efflux RND transporter permease subunit [Gemmatimonadota bacterium]